MSIETRQSIIERVLRDSGHGHLVRYAGQAARVTEGEYTHADIVGNLRQFVRVHAGSTGGYDVLINRVAEAIVASESPVEVPVPDVDPFEAETVIRTFLQQGYDENVGPSALYAPGEVDALLELAGIITAPKPVEVEGLDEASVAEVYGSNEDPDRTADLTGETIRTDPDPAPLTTQATDVQIGGLSFTSVVEALADLLERAGSEARAFLAGRENRSSDA